VKKIIIFLAASLMFCGQIFSGGFVVPYYRDGSGTVHFLLGKERVSGQGIVWDSFGGQEDGSETDFQAAAREFNEETMYLFAKLFFNIAGRLTSGFDMIKSDIYDKTEHASAQYRRGLNTATEGAINYKLGRTPPTCFLIELRNQGTRGNWHSNVYFLEVPQIAEARMQEFWRSITPAKRARYKVEKSEYKWFSARAVYDAAKLGGSGKLDGVNIRDILVTAIRQDSINYKHVEGLTEIRQPARPQPAEVQPIPAPATQVLPTPAARVRFTDSTKEDDGPPTPAPQRSRQGSGGIGWATEGPQPPEPGAGPIQLFGPGSVMAGGKQQQIPTPALQPAQQPTSVFPDPKDKDEAEPDSPRLSIQDSPPAEPEPLPGPRVPALAPVISPSIPMQPAPGVTASAQPPAGSITTPPPSPAQAPAPTSPQQPKQTIAELSAQFNRQIQEAKNLVANLREQLARDKKTIDGIKKQIDQLDEPVETEHIPRTVVSEDMTNQIKGWTETVKTTSRKEDFRTTIKKANTRITRWLTRPQFRRQKEEFEDIAVQTALKNFIIEADKKFPEVKTGLRLDREFKKFLKTVAGGYKTLLIEADKIETDKDKKSVGIFTRFGFSVAE
jgi:hypothetical protein